jgi:DNA-binding Xre family transcriptional regulator
MGRERRRRTNGELRAGEGEEVVGSKPLRFRLHEILEARGVSQTWLWRNAKVDFGYINAVCQNRTDVVRLRPLARICTVLGVSPGELISSEARVTLRERPLPERSLPPARLVEAMRQCAKRQVAAGHQRVRRDARALGREPVLATLTVPDWLAICAAWGYACAYCGGRPSGEYPDRLVPEHVEPLSRGGEHTAENVVPACVTCNTQKADLFLLEWVLLRLGYFRAVGRRSHRTLRLA